MSDETPDQPLTGSVWIGGVEIGKAKPTSVQLDGVEIGDLIESVTPAAAPETHSLNALYRPCEECNHPAFEMTLDGNQVRPDRITIAWGDDRHTQHMTPHSAGCTVAQRPDHTEGKWITLPGSVLTVTGICGVDLRGGQ